MKLRKHQREAVALAKRIASGHESTVGRKFFSAYVTPGGGKTIMARLFAREMIALGLVKRVLFLAPNELLRNQACAAFAHTRNGPNPLRLRVMTNKQIQDLMDGKQVAMDIDRADGVCATYPQVDAAARVSSDHFPRLVDASDYLVVLDEFHHLPEPEHASWSAAIAPIVKAAKFVLGMTGTMHRTDELRIFEANISEDGRTYAPDVSYGRRIALIEGAILPVDFAMFDGNVIVPYRHEERGALLSQATAKEAGRALLITLKDEGFVRDMVTKCLRDKWLDYRNNHNSRAKALVICHSKAAADAIKPIIEELGVTAVVAHSDVDNAAAVIEAFHHADGADVLISVGMTSEGFDCPAISHLLYLSNIIAPVTLAQAWTRPVRPNRQSPQPVTEQVAFICFPMHPAFVRFAEDWMEEQIGWFEEYEAAQPKQRPEARGRGPGVTGSAEMTAEYNGDEKGRLSDRDQAMRDFVCSKFPDMRHKKTRDIVDMARGLAAMVGAEG